MTALGLSADLLQQMGGEHWSVINEVSGRDIILLLGGLFLIRHSVKEIHEQFEGSNTDVALTTSHTFAGVLINITIMDIIFSLDSVITAVGMTTNLKCHDYGRCCFRPGDDGIRRTDQRFRETKSPPSKRWRSAF